MNKEKLLMNFKTIAIALSAIGVLSIPVLSQAHSSPDEVAVCYSFSGNTLKKTQSCIVSSGGGAGGMYTNIAVGGKKYSMEGPCDNNGNCKFYWNDKPITSYTRDGTFHHKLTQKEISTANHLLYCYKTKNGSLDICHN